MENTQPNQNQAQNQNQGQNKPANQSGNQPVKPFEKLQKQPDNKPLVTPPPAKPPVPPLPPAAKKNDKTAEIKNNKTDDNPYAAWAIGGMIVLALLFYGYQARQDGPTAGIDEDSNGLAVDDSEDTEEDVKDDAEGETLGDSEDAEDEDEVAIEEREDTTLESGVMWSAPIMAPTPVVNSTPEVKIFEKDANMTLREAVQKEFASTLTSPDCYVVNMRNSVPEGYVKVGIYAAPGVTGCGPLGWNNTYYFLMNTEVPTKFAAVYGAGGNVTIEE